MFSLGFGRAVALPLLGKDDGLVTNKVITALLLIAEELGNYSMSGLENSAQNETIVSQAVQAGSAAVVSSMWNSFLCGGYQFTPFISQNFFFTRPENRAQGPVLGSMCLPLSQIPKLVFFNHSF